jgi:ERCC4-type nuclease
MKVIIDERERDLYAQLSSIASSNPGYVQLSKEVLPLGDISITTDEGKPVILIERKSLRDLLASIKDGRYEEQSYRLIHSSGFPPHSILYIIEGSLGELRTVMEKKIVYSAMTSLNFFKGFSILRTMSVKETAEHILWMSEKIEKNFLKAVFPYYLQPQFAKYMQRPVVDVLEPPLTEEDDEIPGSMEKRPIQNSEIQNILREPVTNVIETDIYSASTVVEQVTTGNYCSVVKKVKKDNVTPENIGEIILCQIPGISSVSAVSIMKKFTTFPKLIKELETTPGCLDDIMCESNGKSRKLSKTIIENIKKYLAGS